MITKISEITGQNVDWENLGKRVRKFREEKALNITEIAGKLGIPEGAILGLEFSRNKETRKSINIIWALSHKFNLSLNWLLNGVGKRGFGQRFLGALQQMRDGEIKGVGRFHLAEGLFIITREQIERVVPATAGTMHVTLQHGERHSVGARAAVFKAAFKGGRVGKRGRFSEIAAHLQIGIQAGLDAAKQFEDMTAVVHD